MKIIEEVRNGNSAVVAGAIANGMDPNVRIGPSTLLIQAAASVNLEMLGFLLDHGANINGQDRSGVTALMVSIDMGYTNVSRILVERGADVNVQTPKGYAAINIAIAAGDERIIRMLVRNGAKLDHVASNGETLILQAFRTRQHTSAAVLLDMDAVRVQHVITELPAKIRGPITEFVRTAPALYAADQGDVPALRAYFSAGGSANIADRLGFTLLVKAVHAKSIDAVASIIENGAFVDPDIVDESALMVASRLGYIEIIEYLLAHGAQIDWRDRAGVTPLADAAGAGQLDAVKLLLARGADIQNGGEALDFARKKGRDDVVKYLQHCMPGLF